MYPLVACLRRRGGWISSSILIYILLQSLVVSRKFNCKVPPGQEGSIGWCICIEIGDLEHGISPVMKDTTNFNTAREEKIIQEYSTVEKEEEESQPPTRCHHGCSNDFPGAERVH